MKVVFFVLADVSLLEELLSELGSAGIRGVTVMKSSGMGRELSRLANEENPFLTLRNLFNPERAESRTLMMVAKEIRIPIIRDVIYRVVGDLSKPETGVLFTIPIDFVEGVG